jgi:hypothetical protein
VKAPQTIAAVAALVLVGGGLGLLRWQRAVIATEAARVKASALPDLALSHDDAARVTKLVITRPGDDDAGPGADGGVRPLVTVTLERRGAGWAMTTPLVTTASRPVVEEALHNLETLHLWKQLDAGTRFYPDYDLTEDKALHIVAWRGSDKIVDLICGKGAAEGQLVRLPDRDGIYALVNWGPQTYQGFLFTRAVRDWREASIFKFDPKDAVRIEIRNATGVFVFTRQDAHWVGAHGRPGKAPAGPWPRFDETKIANMLREYGTLAADNFADGTTAAEAGLDDAERIGGVLRIALKSGEVLALRVGKLAHDTSRYAIRDSRWAVKDGGDGTIYALSPWTAGWALADARKFE